ncbi:MAG: ParB N-terminal domain-containing protein [Oscillibacter sp.]|nr:ParB N-terminal domain-containing protein [Oscillibacter sp.]
MKLHIFQIKVNAGRREANPEAVHELADSISKVGLLNPITVDQEHTLIAGLHRLEAAKMLGWTEIECNVSDLEGLLAELAEIDENLIRQGLDYIDEGKQLARRKEIYETLHPETRQGQRNGQTSKNETVSVLENKSFARDTAEKLGVSPRCIEQKIQVAKKLTPEAKEIVKGNDIGFKNALKLSRLAPEQQKEAATRLAAGDIKSIDEYHPVPSEQEAAEEQAPETPLEPKPPETMPETAVSPTLGTGCYPTIRDSVADLKDPYKDRRCTPDSFLATFSYFLQRFCQSMENYTGPEYDAVLPILTQEHLNLIHQKIQLVHTALDELLNEIERKAQNGTA